MSDKNPIFQFSNVVVVEGNLIGCIVKTWGASINRGVHYDVYVRSYNSLVEYDEKDFKDFVERNKGLFDKHIAKVIKVDTGENDCIVEFRNPSTSNGWMVFTYIKGYLSINGDYGSGSFTWYNSRNTFEWMADTGFCYFMRKITAGESAEGNRLMREYDSDYCIASVEEYIKDYEIEMEDDDWKSHTEDHYEWVSWLRENGEEYFGQDHWEWSGDCGITYKTRAYVWKYGLIKAAEYISRLEG